MTASTTDADLLSTINRELFTGVIGDVMDKLGLRRQFLPPDIRVLRADMKLAGRAKPALESDMHPDAAETSANAAFRQSFGLMLDALDSLAENEIYVCTGASPAYALWGGLMTTRALQLGAAGAVLDGYLRDTGEILAQNFPIMSRGAYAQDQAPRGKVVDYDVPIEFGGVEIRPGDMMVGDVDGVLVVPRHAEAEVIALALEKVRGEGTVRAALERGMSAREAFATFGIL